MIQVLYLIQVAQNRKFAVVGYYLVEIHVSDLHHQSHHFSGCFFNPQWKQFLLNKVLVRMYTCLSTVTLVLRTRMFISTWADEFKMVMQKSIACAFHVLSPWWNRKIHDIWCTLHCCCLEILSYLWICWKKDSIFRIEWVYLIYWLHFLVMFHNKLHFLVIVWRAQCLPVILKKWEEAVWW